MMLTYFLLLSIQIHHVLGIYGGCMSYSITIESSGRTKVHLFFLNGWQIGKGPCYQCKAEDKGKYVTDRRQHFLQQSGDPYVLGKWTVEMEHNMTASYLNKTEEINNASKDIVLIVSEKEKWELIGSEISLDLQSTNEQFDIQFTGAIDNKMKLLPNAKDILLQVKMNPGIRSDTHKPNQSPVVLVKPLYSLELGKKYDIHLTSIDNDGDATRCDRAQYTEAIQIGPFLSDLRDRGFFSLDRLKCLMTIKVNSGYFHENDTFAAAITVKDYNVIPMSIQGSVLVPHVPYKHVIGRVVVLMYFVITGRTDPPEFIPPTPANNQEYTVYVGGDFHVNVYAKASPGRQIVRFDFLRRDGKPVNHTGIQNAPNVASNAVFISTKWSPSIPDIGHHILCANAEDNQGRMTVDLHCFRIIVKEHIFRPRPAVVGKPYFVSFPESLDLTCKKDTYCRFPVYATTSDPGGITSIVSTPNSKENVTIQYSRELINRTIECKVAQVEFFASQVGPRQICLNASDSKSSSQRCLFVTVQLPDPCASEPCQHASRCFAFDDNSGFNCACTNLYSGRLCETKINVCNRKPCLSNGTCKQVPWMSKPSFICTCPNGKTGAVCESDIDRCSSNPCSDTEICHSSGHDVCVAKKDPVGCPNPSSCQLSTTSACVKDSSNNPECVCALGRLDDGTCNIYSSPFTVNPTPPHFVPPTPGLGTTIQCDTDRGDCRFSVFVLSSDAVDVSYFGGDTLDTFTVHVAECIKEGSEPVCRAVVKFTKSSQTILDHTPKKYDVCLNVARTASPRTFTDKSCVRVVFQPKARGNLTANASCAFAAETLPKDSTIGCKKGVPCHFFVYTPHSNGSCATISTDSEYAAVYKPLSLTSPDLCRYDVVSTNTTTTGTNKVCLKPCLRGESRCFLLNVHDIPDQCTSKPCQNGGACQTLRNGDLKCYCTPKFWGKHCENGFCDSSTHCMNDGVCYKSNNDTTCLCKLGFTGPTCSFEANKNFTSTTDNGGHFTEMALLERVTCYLNTPCTFPFSITRNVNHMPTLVLGSMDRSLEVSELDLQPLSSSQTVLSGKMVVTGSELGLKSVCVDSVNTPRNGKTEDEICFKINVITGNSLKPDELKPHFVSPTFPDETIFQCQQHDQCHISLWAKNAITETNCPVLKADKTTEDGVYVFPQTNSTHIPCVFDAVVTVNNITSLGLCFSLLDDVGKNADKRCYTIHVVGKTSVRGVCAGVSCYNDGFCDGRMLNANCRCRSGFSGPNCSTDTGEVQGDKTYSPGSPLFGDVMLPKLIKCPLSKLCVIQFTVSNIAQFNITSNGTNIDTKNLTSFKFVGSRDFSGKANVIHKRTGTDDFCLFLSSSIGDVYDETCCQIVTDPSTATNPPDDGEPHFIVPSPNNGSEFSCTPGKPCHMTLSLNKGSNLKCPEIKHSSGNETVVHIFNTVPSTSTEECDMDIWFGSSATDNGITEHCFQGYGSGVLGEIRCYKVHFEPHVRPSPPTTIMVTTTSIQTGSTAVNVQMENATTQTTGGNSDQTTTGITQTSGVSDHVSTTQGSGVSSQGHVSTTQGSGVSSQGHASTTQRSVVSSQGHVSTIQGYGVSSQGHASTTQRSGVSSQGHVSTIQGSGVSSQGHASTTQQSGVSSQGHVSTTQGSSVSSQGHVSTIQGSGVSSQGHVSTTQVSSVSSQGHVSTVQGSGVSSQGHVSTTQGGSGVSSQGHVSTIQGGSTVISQGHVSTTQGRSGVSSQGHVSTIQGSGVSSDGQSSSSQATHLASISAPSPLSVASGSNQSPTSFRNITTVLPGTESHCDIKKVKEKAKNGRVECFCLHPTTGVRTKVITLNPRVSTERLLLAAGLGSGAMIITIGLATVLYLLTQKYSRPNKSEPTRKTKNAKKKISVSSISSKTK